MSGHTVLNRFAVLCIIGCFMTVNMFGQMTFPFWEDKEDLQSAFHHNPSYFPEAPTIFAPIGTAAYTLSNSSTPVYFMEEQYPEANSFIGTGSNYTAERDAIADSTEVRNRSAELLDMLGTSGSSILSHRSLSMGLGASWRMDAKKKSKRRRTMRIGLTMSRRADLNYGTDFSTFARTPDFSGPAIGTVPELGEFAFRYQSHSSFVLGQTIEIVPMRLFFGYNIEAMAGMKYADARPGSRSGETVITTAGYEVENGRLLEKTRFLSGYGGSIDLGMSYRFDRNWTLSASIMDVGAIQWDSLYQRTVTDAPEVVFGLQPLSNIPVEYDGTQYENQIRQDSAVLLEGADALIEMDRRVNFGLSSEYERLGLYVNVSQALDYQDEVPDAMTSSARISYLLNHEGKVRLNLTAGVNVGSDSGSSVHIGGRLDLEVIDVFVASDGFLLSSSPRANNLLIVGVQFCPLGKRNRDRL